MVLGRLSVGQRLWVNVGLAILAIALVLIFVLFQFRDSQVAERKLAMHDLVESAYSIIEYQGQQASSGVISVEAAKRRAASTIEALRYGDAGYFWINDTSPTMVMHPHKPQLNGKDLSKVEDPSGKRLFVDFVKTATQQPKGGVVEYSWAKPGEEGQFPKVSYVKLYKPWQWIVGSGVYVDDINEAFWYQAKILGLVVAVISILLLAVSGLITRSLLLPIHKLEETIIHVCEKGDLAIRADIKQGGELGLMSSAFDGMLRHLQEFVHEVERAVNEMASAATQLATITGQTQNSIEVARGQTTQVATAMTEMSATVKEIAANTVNTADASQDADHQVEQGTAVVGETTESITHLASEVRKASEVIQQLEQDSVSIGNVLSVIEGIAEQTNLLALNAAIEAARAGEQGRGFAVVADEVRELAQRTQDSTSDIQQIIEGLQQRTQSVVSVMHVGQEQAQLSVERAEKAVQSLNAISEAVSKIKHMTTQIATASEEQSVVAEEVHQSIIQVDGIAEETMTGATEIAQASRSLSQLAEHLRKTTGQFTG